MTIFYPGQILFYMRRIGKTVQEKLMGVYKVNVIEAIKSFLFTSFRLPPYGTRMTFTIHTSHILLHLTVMALREQSCAHGNLARWRKQ